MNLPTKIGVTYVVTDVADCTVTDSNGVVLCEHSGGSEQSQFTATTMSVSIDSTTASVRETFNHAPAGNGNGGGLTPEEREKLLTTDGERIITAPAALQTGAAMRNGVWYLIPAESAMVIIETASATDRALSMQLLLTPAADMHAGWLTSADPALPVHWPYGEPMLAGGFRYCVTVVQMPWGILANMTPLGAQPTA